MGESAEYIRALFSNLFDGHRRFNKRYDVSRFGLLVNLDDIQFESTM